VTKIFFGKGEYIYKWPTGRLRERMKNIATNIAMSEILNVKRIPDPLLRHRSPRSSLNCIVAVTISYNLVMTATVLLMNAMLYS
jgi:hypothetical protein